MFRGNRQGARAPGSFSIIVDDAFRLRACAFVAGVGSYVKAASRLGVAVSSIEAACDRGHIKAQTVERLREALDREAPVVKAAS